MNTKTKTWKELADNDLSFAECLLHDKHKAYYAAYFCHQAIEKIIKAIIAHRSEKTPLPTHNFKLLLDQAELKNIPEDKKKFIFGLQPHYIGTKYPEDIAKLYKQYTITFVQNLFKETREVFQWLENYLK